MAGMATSGGTSVERAAAPMTARRGATGAPVDLVHLARQTFGSAELEREVLGLFVEQGPGLVRRIHDGPAGERAALVHRLKGSARGIGATRVAQLCEEIETSAAAGISTEPATAALEAAVDEVARFVRTLTGPRA